MTLANMMSIGLQSGATRLPNIPQQQGTVAQEGSVAGQLHLMTAAHHAQQHQPPPAILAAASGSATPTRPPHHADPAHLLVYQQQQQHRTLGNITNATRGTQVRPPVAVAGVSAIPTAQLQTPPVPKTTPPRMTTEVAVKSFPGPESQQRAQYYGHNPNLKLPPGLCLLGCVFYIAKYPVGATKEQVDNAIIQRGGELESHYNPKVTHVLCDTLAHDVVRQALRDNKRCITVYWLNDVVLKSQVLPPWQALHFPVAFSEDEQPCKQFCMSYSGFEGEERNRIRNMITATGAQCTRYISRFNKFLICKGPRGKKFELARSSKVPVVNAQWLNEILFGHFSCLKQTDAEKYQTYNVPNPLRVDYTQVQPLMAPWKNPINIMQESYEKVKTLPLTNPRPAKRPRLDKSLSRDQDDFEEAGDSANNGMEVIKKEPMTENEIPIVLFSSVYFGDKLRDLSSKLCQLGGTISKMSERKTATHYVTKGPTALTENVLCCLPTAKYFVSEQWVLDSYLQNKFLDEKPYCARDCIKQEYGLPGVPVQKLLETPNRTQLFKGKMFYLTPSSIPNRKVLREMIENSGGIVLKHTPTVKHVLDLNKEQLQFILVMHEQDAFMVPDLVSAKVAMCEAKVVIKCIIEQRDITSFIIKTLY